MTAPGPLSMHNTQALTPIKEVVALEYVKKRRTMAEIATKYGISRTTVYKRLQAAGVPSRPRTSPNPRPDVGRDAVIRLCWEGRTLGGIAAILCTTATTVHYRLGKDGPRIRRVLALRRKVAKLEARLEATAEEISALLRDTAEAN